jgi:c-di-GMP-related signal transduction protein
MVISTHCALIRYRSCVARARDSWNLPLAGCGPMTIGLLVHVLFGGTIENIVSTLPIHADIRRALLERHGELGLLLNAIEAAESGKLMAIRAASDALPVFTPNDLIMLGLAATAWYDDHVRGHLNTAGDHVLYPI